MYQYFNRESSFLHQETFDGVTNKVLVIVCEAKDADNWDRIYIPGLPRDYNQFFY
jgi:uncharacterized protein YihD (DUF1040 family)